MKKMMTMLATSGVAGLIVVGASSAMSVNGSSAMDSVPMRASVPSSNQPAVNGRSSAHDGANRHASDAAHAAFAEWLAQQPDTAGAQLIGAEDGATVPNRIVVYLVGTDPDRRAQIVARASALGVEVPVEIVDTSLSWAELAAASEVLHRLAHDYETGIVDQVPGAQRLYDDPAFQSRILAGLPSDLTAALRDGSALPAGYSIA